MKPAAMYCWWPITGSTGADDFYALPSKAKIWKFSRKYSISTYIRVSADKDAINSFEAIGILNPIFWKII